MVTPVQTWILLASGKGARILVNDGIGHGLKPADSAAFTREPKRDRDIYSDRPGRVHDRIGPARHAAERPTSGGEQDRRKFVDKIVGHLHKSCLAGKFDRLILVAEPSLLGLLRPALSPAVAGLVVGEIPKDLSRVETSALLEALSVHMPV